ncbi:glutamate 5-kinase [Porticoccus sp. W117]|uniref:glutamate 5-kinase n=1 Tax=Porticoccus sp. W117 TaxID=3054777 RepID=UPI00259521D3|nr:glutamate 5-kinase [Porticoccus sp. W117]MDM3871496.1 glutamate 5-kinase [Porticoccus sp. W117]
MNIRNQLKQSRRWVVKIGSALLTDNGQCLDRDAINQWAKQLAFLRDQGVEVVLVSSGAVAAGISQLGLSERPQNMHQLQAVAAVGQMGLVQTWQSALQQHSLQTAQILLTHDDLSNRHRYLNARSTLRSLLDLGVIPVINENDTVVTDEIRFGDNDTLGALVANLVEADTLAILTDQEGLYSADPRSNPDATLISEERAANSELDKLAGDGGTLGRGGMVTKLRAARLAARSGTHTLIAWGREAEILTRLHSGESLGTCLRADEQPVAARKQWLAGHLQFCGTLTLDDGAVKVLQQQGKSLLPIGVTKVEGNFQRGDLVRCVDKNGSEIARGLVNYSAVDSAKICGKNSGDIARLLGFIDSEELIHRNNMVVV